jgi:hypothetical protein
VLQNIIENILQWLSGTMPTPVPYQSFEQSWFHYLACIIIIIFSYISFRYIKNGSPQRVKKYVLIIGIILLTFEAYKQLIMNYQAGWSYQWYIFPFQFCSTPMYVALLAGLIKPGKFQNTLYSFLATYGLFAGAAVLIYPNDVFIHLIGINIQTMVHHGAMTVMGLTLLVNVVKLEHKIIFKASSVFIVLLIMAMIMNAAHNTWIHEGTFNMFFINQQYDNHLPILSTIYDMFPYTVFLLTYIIGFAIAAYLVLLIGLFIKKINILTHRVRQPISEKVQ